MDTTIRLLYKRIKVRTRSGSLYMELRSDGGADRTWMGCALHAGTQDPAVMRELGLDRRHAVIDCDGYDEAMHELERTVARWRTAHTVNAVVDVTPRTLCDSVVDGKLLSPVGPAALARVQHAGRYRARTVAAFS